jgi:hypothetical protein
VGIGNDDHRGQGRRQAWAASWASETSVGRQGATIRRGGLDARGACSLGVGGGRREYGGDAAKDLAGDGGRQVGEEWVGVHSGARLVGDGRVDVVVRYSDFNSY